MNQKLILLILFLFSFIASCEIINPDEDIPAFVRINSVGFKTDPGQGTDSVKITDAWIYIDSELIGAYQIPAEIPILKQGNQNLEVRFGVLLNGIDATRTINPFYNYDNEIVNLVPSEEIVLKPNSEYNPLTKFIWNSIGQEGFEEGGISIDSVAGTSTKIIKTSQEVYEGSFSGQIHLDAGHQTYIGQSSDKFELPKQGQAVVMEIHCKNTSNHFAIGMFVEATDGKITIVNHLVVNPGPRWKKLYVNFTELVSYYPQARSFRVFFTSELESGNTTTDIYLDNIKLMHF
ncbi:MAG: hypothetical protein DRI84_00815 [Bacteroidetes bacterium]|nr:MAG: hypothetical protein DRI84_00815 [Bacteroidota bacterium]